MNLPQLLSASLVGSLVLASPANAQFLDVPGDHDTIQAAVDAASDGTTILVYPGTYPLSAPINTLGKDIALRSVGGPEVTVLDGQNSSRIFHFDLGEPPSTEIEGFTLTRGQAPVASTPGTIGDGGGAILIEDSNPTFIDCIIRDCRADDGVAPSEGVKGPRGGHGGGVYADGGTTRFFSCRFINNSAGDGGRGGTGSTGITGEAGGPGFLGGNGGAGSAIFAIGTAVLQIEGCLFVDNRCGKGGQGGFGGQGGQGDSGPFGGFVGVGGSGGQGGQGGVGGAGTIYGSGGAFLNIDSCTFLDNAAGAAGDPGIGGAGGAGLIPGFPGIPGDNGVCSTRPGIAIDGASSGQTHNNLLFDLDSCGLGLQEIWSPFEPEHCATRSAAVGVGSIQIDQSWLDAGYVPLEGSPLIDAGNDALLSANFATDLSGGPRLFDKPNFGTNLTLDIGAFENRRGVWTSLTSQCSTHLPGTLANLGGVPTIGETLSLGVDDPYGFSSPGSLAILAGNNSTVGAPCGTLVPGWGLEPGTAGGSLLSFEGNFSLYGVQPWIGPGTPSVFNLPLPDNASIIGKTWTFQGALIDPLTFEIGLTEVQIATFGD